MQKKQLYYIKHKKNDENLSLTLFNNRRIQTCAAFHVQNNLESVKYQEVNVRKREREYAAQTYLSLPHKQRQINRNLISPLLQMKIQRQIREDPQLTQPTDISSPFNQLDNSMPQTGHLLKRARKAHDENLKYTFVKKWERAQIEQDQKRKYKNNTFTQCFYPININPKTTFQTPQLDSLLKQPNQKPLKTQSSQLSMPSNVPQNSVQMRLSLCNEQSLPSASYEVRYASNVRERNPDRIISPKYPNLGNYQKQLEVCKKQYESIEKRKNNNIPQRSDTHQFVLDISQLDTSLKQFLIDKELGDTKDKGAMYLHRNTRLEVDLKTSKNTNQIMRINKDNRSKTALQQQFVLELIGNNMNDLDKTQQAMNNTMVKIEQSPRVNNYPKQSKTNPYIIAKNTFKLQKLDQKQWKQIL